MPQKCQKTFQTCQQKPPQTPAVSAPNGRRDGHLRRRAPADRGPGGCLARAPAGGQAAKAAATAGGGERGGLGGSSNTK